jgi:hypothetical protein
LKRSEAGWLTFFGVFALMALMPLFLGFAAFGLIVISTREPWSATSLAALAVTASSLATVAACAVAIKQLLGAGSTWLPVAAAAVLAYGSLAAATRTLELMRAFGSD